MKFSRLLIALFISSFAFVACNNDDDNTYVNIREDMAMMRVQGRLVTSLITDENEKLTLPEDWKVDSAFARPDTTYRVMIQYSKVDDSTPITTYAAAVVPVYSPAPVYEGADEFARKPRTTKDDPVDLQSVWVSTNGSYINLYYFILNNNADISKHIIDVTEDSVTVLPNGQNRHHLTLRHDRAAMPESYSIPAFLSIPLSSYNKGEEVVMRAKLYGGKLYEKSFTIK